MSYTIKPWDACDATWDGLPVYEIKPWDACNASWYVAPAGSHCELRGDVYQDGALVDRRVRAHRHDTGAVIGEANTTGGHFVIALDDADWVSVLCYVVPLDMSVGAQDWSPPVANRVYPVLVTA